MSGVGQDVERHVATAGVETDVGVRVRRDVVIAESEEDAAVQLGGERCAVADLQGVDVALARPAHGLGIVGGDDLGGHVGAMQPAVMGLAWHEAIDVIPAVSEERARLVDRGLPPSLGVGIGVAFHAAGSADRQSFSHA